MKMDDAERERVTLELARLARRCLVCDEEIPATIQDYPIETNVVVSGPNWKGCCSKECARVLYAIQH